MALQRSKKTNRQIVLACEDCLHRNYTTPINKSAHPERMTLKKFCPHCGKHSVHRETR